MSAARWLVSQGVRVLAEGDTLTLEGLAALTPEQAAKVVAYARQNKARLLEELGGLSGLPWPEPEQEPMQVYSLPWRYTCLYAIVSVYGAVLSRNTLGGLALTCPVTMPPGAAQAARDGLAALAGYIEARRQR
jgi:hypothetical protein